MSVVSPQVQSWLDQLYAEAGSIPGAWLDDGSLYYVKAAPNEFAPHSVVASAAANAADILANAADILANAADIGTNSGAITALQNLLGTDAVLSDASFTVGAGGTQVLPNTPVVGRRLDVFIDGALLREGGGADYTISGATITFVGAHTAVVLVVKYVY